MPGRRRAREFALQVLYQADLFEALPGNPIQSLWTVLKDDDPSIVAAPFTREESEFADLVVEGVWRGRARFDSLIEAASLNWRLSRMPVVDRNILRIACYELLERPDIPVSVTINEAVEMAKRFGGADSRAFVNGILDRIAFDSGRGGRGPRRA